MNYLLKNNYKSRNRNSRLKIILIIIIIIILFFISRAGLFGGVINTIAVPLWKMSNYTSDKFSDMFSTVRSKKSLISEVRNLKEELSIAGVNLLIQKVYQKENDDLKALLGRNSDRKKDILSAVLVRPGMSPFDIMIIDIGKSSGVKVGDKVLYNGSLIIGIVSEVDIKSSKVKLFSSPGEKHIALIGPKSVQVEVEGFGAGNFVAKLPRDIEIKEGDEVVMPGLSTSILGFVQKIESGVADSFQKIIFKIPVNLSEIKWVGVEIN